MKFWDKAWSLVDQCTPVSEGCNECWLRSIDKRFGREWDGNVSFRSDRLDIPLKTKKPTVFAIWSDLYHEKVSYEQLGKTVGVMFDNPRHTFLIVTKRPERPAAQAVQKTHFPGNVYHLVTVENQEMADKRIPYALQIPGKVGLLLEPMLSAIDLNSAIPANHACRKCCGGECPDCGHNPWEFVICGGETGPKARPMHPDLVRSVRDQCTAAGVPFMFKGWGEWVADDFDTVTPSGYAPRRCFLDLTGEPFHTLPSYHPAICMMKIGAKKAGRVLDGKEYNSLAWGNHDEKKG